MQGVFGISSSAVGVGGSIVSMPSASNLSLNSSQASSVDVPAVPTPGLCHFFMCFRIFIDFDHSTYSRSALLLCISIYLLTLIIAPVVPQLPLVTENKAQLVLVPDTNALMLTMQHLLLCLVNWDSFNILCVLLMFVNAFPNAPLAVQFVKDTLLHSALNHTPCVANIYQQLLTNEEYICKIVPLVSCMNTCEYSC